MRVELLDYHLPPELIAQRPVEPRGASRLLAVDCDTGAVEHRLFRDLTAYLRRGDCMVFNSSRVRRSRLRGRKEEGGAAVEMLLLRPLGDGEWEALARPARRLKKGTRVLFAGGDLEGEIVDRGERGLIRVRMRPGEPERVEGMLERYGEVPLPPYIKEKLEDPDRYQTVFADVVGSAAAPTAGLHFDLSALNSLEENGIRLAFLRLEVGLDTFRPLEGGEVEEHRLHSESVYVGAETCEAAAAARREGNRVVAVGTTVVRALESAAAGGGLAPFDGPTNLFIYPGYRFQAVDCLLTNFHMPRSSLLALVCAFAGRELVMEAYREAVKEKYRFLSFGDACYFYYREGWRQPGPESGVEEPGRGEAREEGKR